MGLPYNPYDPPKSYWEGPPEEAPDLLATRWQRLGGAIVDTFFDGFMAWIPAVLLHAASLDPFPKPAGKQVSWMPSPLLMLLFSALPTAIQWWLIARSGQSVGKKLAETRIVTLDGTVAGFVHGVALRWMPRLALSIVDTLMATFAPWAMLVKTAVSGAISLVLVADPLFIFGPDKRCVHDYIAGTRVVRTRRR
jgi:uncharacterized RDD family membrane protein YckC